jgi:hypothetical protein
MVADAVAAPAPQVEGADHRIALDLAAAQVAAHVGAVGVQDMHFIVIAAAVRHQLGAEDLQLARLVADAARVADDVPAAGVTLRARLGLDDVRLTPGLPILFNDCHVLCSLC